MKTSYFFVIIGLVTGCGGVTSVPGRAGSGGTAGTTSGTGGGAPGSGGTAGSGGALPEAGKVCGTIAGLTCGSDEWCDYTETYPRNGVVQCGGDDGGGICRLRPQGCPADCPGVCGCDGKFYCNACLAHQAGVDDTSSQACMKTGGGAGADCTTDADCQSSLKCCYPCGIAGCTMQCMQPQPDGLCPVFN